MRSGGLRLATSAPQQEVKEYNPDTEPSPDEVWETFASNPDLDFDHTTEEGRRLYELFEIADKERHKFTMQTFKDMATMVASVPASIVSGTVRSPTKIPFSMADAVLRDVRDVYGLIAQSEDTNSPMFRFKDLIWGTGTVESRIKQFNEARWFGRRSRELEEGKGTLLGDYVPEDMRKFTESLIDPKLAHALSYLGLEIPALLMGAVKGTSRKAFRSSMDTYRNSDLAAASLAADDANGAFKQIKDAMDNSAKRFGALAKQVGGTALTEGAEIAQKPFSYIKSKIESGTSTVSEATGANSSVLRNAVTTAMAEAGEKATSVSPMRSTLFSLGMKPLMEYASALGNEIVDAAQGVVQSKSSQLGMTTLERLARNGGRIPLSTEAQAVAKMANVVVGWPMSMSMPTLKRALGDSAYMGVLGFLNARGEGAAAGMGVGFAWGGMSGAMRHLHNIYNHSAGHELLIKNFDEITLRNVERESPDNAHAIKSIVSAVDELQDYRVSSTVRASIEMALASNKAVRFVYGDYSDYLSAGGAPDPLAERARGANDGKIIWINKGYLGNSPEVIAHEAIHSVINKHIWDSFDDKNSVMESFFGTRRDGGFMRDSDMIELMADYLSKAKGVSIEIARAHVQAAFFEFREMQAKGDVDFTDLVNSGGQLAVPRYFSENNGLGGTHGPTLKLVFDETMAYYTSQAFLNKGADYYLRNPHERGIRNWAENFMMLKTQRQVASLEEAGVLVKRALNNSRKEKRSAFECVFWEDGRFMAVPVLDDIVSQITQRAMRHGDVNVTLMSPERAAAWFKDAGKEQFARTIKGGMVAKSKKEIDDILTQNAEKLDALLRGMPQDKQPKFEVLEGGNQMLDLTNLGKEHWDVIKGSGMFSQKDLDALVTISNVVRDTRAGKPVFNTFTGQYIGRTHQVEIGSMVKRLTGNDVPVTFRHFSPFAIELRYDKFDSEGRPLRKPKGHITLHVVDVAVLNRRRMKMWSRPEVRALFTDFGHFTRTFANYMANLSQDSSKRLPSAEFFRPEFGSNAEKVRDFMYETFGGRKRQDESYANVPTTGYAGNKDGPNYPFHSLRFELLANLERRSTVFSETFGNKLSYLPYNHAKAYDGIRTNLMAGGFTERVLASGKSYYGNHLGYEIRQSGKKLNVFSPYGTLLGTFVTLKRATSFAEKHAKDLPPEEVFSRGSESTEPNKEEYAINVRRSDIYTSATNLMVGKDDQIYSLKLKGRPAEISKKLRMAQPELGDTRFGGRAQVHGYNLVKVSDIVEEAALFKDFPEIGEMKIGIHAHARWNGNYAYGLTTARETDMLLVVHPDALSPDHVPALLTHLQMAIQARIDLTLTKAGVHPYTVSPAGAFDPTLTAQQATILAAQQFNEELSDFLKANQGMTVNDYFDARVRDEISGNINLFLEEETKPERKFAVFQTLLGKGYGKVHAGSQTGTRIARFAFTTPSSPLGANSFGRWRDGIPDKNGNKDQKPFHKGENEFYFKDSPSQDEAVRRIHALNDYYVGVLDKFRDGQYKSVVVGNQVLILAEEGVVHMPPSVRAILNSIEVDVRSTGRTIDLENDPSSTLGPTDGMVVHSRTMNGLYALLHHVSVSTESREMDPSIKAERNVYEDIFNSQMGADGGVISDIQGQIRRANEAFGTGLTIIGIAAPTGKNMAKGFATLVGNAHGVGFSVMNSSPNLETRRHNIQKLGGKGVVMDLGIHLAFGNNLPFKSIDANVPAGTQLKFSLDWRKHAQLASVLVADAYSGELLKEIQTHIASEPPNFAAAARLMERSDLQGQAKFVAYRAVSAAEMMSRGHGLITLGGQDLVMGRLLVNKGFESLISLAIDAGEQRLSPKNIGKSITQRAFMEKPDGLKREQMVAVEVAKHLKSVADSVLADGYTTDPTPIMKSNLMVGGFRGSQNADEIAMAKLGMLRAVRLDDGRLIRAFEFTDSRSEINLNLSNGKLTALPFSGGNVSPTAGLDYFVSRFNELKYLNTRPRILQAFKDAKANNHVKPVRLGDLLKHDQLYTFYPELRYVMVVFVEGGDGAYYPARNEIHIGVNNLLLKELHERGVKDATNELFDHPVYGLSDTRMMGDMRDLLLHEIQHAVQKIEFWTGEDYIVDAQNPGDPTVNINTIGTKILPLLLREIVGLKGVDLAEILSDGDRATKSMLFKSLTRNGVSFDQIEQDAKSLPSAVAEAKMMEIFSSPMAVRLGLIAKGMLSSQAAKASQWSRAALMSLPQASKEAKAVMEYVRVCDEIKAETDMIIEAVRQGEISEEKANMLLFVRDGGPFETLHNATMDTRRSLREYPDLALELIELGELDGEVPRHTVFELVRWFSSAKYWKENRSGSSILEAPHRRAIIRSLEFLAYRMSMPERQANATARKSRKTQMELNEESQGVGPTFSEFESETLDAISVGGGNSIPELLAKMDKRQGIQFGSTNLMVGGVGKAGRDYTSEVKGDRAMRAARLAQPEPIKGWEDNSLNYIRGIAKNVIISYRLTALRGDMTRLNMYLLEGRGWEVLEDGSMRLVDKRAVVQSDRRISKDDATAVGNRLMGASNADFREYQNPLTEVQVSTSGGQLTRSDVIHAVTHDMGRTLTLQEIADAFGAKVISEFTEETPTRLVNAIMSENFPLRVKSEDVRGILKGLGMTDDDFSLANLSSFEEAFVGTTVSKELLVNVLCLSHKQLITSEVFGKAFIQEKINRALNDVVVDAKAMRKHLLALFDKGELSKGVRRVLEEPDGSVRTQIETKSVPTTLFGQVVFEKEELWFRPERPSYITEQDWNAWIESLKRRGITKGRMGIKLRPTESIEDTSNFTSANNYEDVLLEGRKVETKGEVADSLKLRAVRMNMLLRSSLLALDSFIHHVYKNIVEPEQKRMTAMMLLDAAFLGNVVVRPFVGKDTKLTLLKSKSDGSFTYDRRGDGEGSLDSEEIGEASSGLAPSDVKLTALFSSPDALERAIRRKVFASGDYGEFILNFLSDGIFPSGANPDAFNDPTGFSVRTMLQPTVGHTVSFGLGWASRNSVSELSGQAPAPQFLVEGRNIHSFEDIGMLRGYLAPSAGDAVPYGRYSLDKWLYAHDSYAASTASVMGTGRNTEAQSPTYAGIPFSIQTMADVTDGMLAYVSTVARGLVQNNIAIQKGPYPEAFKIEMANVSGVVSALHKMQSLIAASMDKLPLVTGNMGQYKVGRSSANEIIKPIRTPLIGGVRGYMSRDGVPVISLSETERASSVHVEAVQEQIVNVDADQSPRVLSDDIQGLIGENFDVEASTSQAISSTIMVGDNEVVRAGTVQDIISVSVDESIRTVNAEATDMQSMPSEEARQFSADALKNWNNLIAGRSPLVYAIYQFFDRQGGGRRGGEMLGNDPQAADAIQWYSREANPNNLLSEGVTSHPFGRDAVNGNLVPFEGASIPLVFASSFHSIARALSENVMSYENGRATRTGFLSMEARSNYEACLAKGNSVEVSDIVKFITSLTQSECEAIAKHASQEGSASQACMNMSYINAMRQVAVMKDPPPALIRFFFGADATVQNTDFRGEFRKYIRRGLQMNVDEFAGETLGVDRAAGIGFFKAVQLRAVLACCQYVNRESVSAWMAYFKTINGLRNIPAFEFTGNTVLAGEAGKSVAIGNPSASTTSKLVEQISGPILSSGRYGNLKASKANSYRAFEQASGTTKHPLAVANALFLKEGDLSAEAHDRLGRDFKATAREVLDGARFAEVVMIEGSMADVILSGGFKTSFADDNRPFPRIANNQPAVPSAVASNTLILKTTNSETLRTGTELTAPFGRRIVKNAISRTLEASRSTSLSVEPVRYQTAGYVPYPASSTVDRKLGAKTAKVVTAESGVLGIATLPSGYYVVNPAISSVNLQGEVSGGNVQSANPMTSASAGFLSNPYVSHDYGFAFKRLSDGRIVINITGSVYNNKEVYTNLRLPRDIQRQTGVDLRESLGYDPLSGTVYGQSMFVSPDYSQYEGGRSGGRRYDLLRMNGGSWSEEIVKSAVIAAKQSSPFRKSVQGKLLSEQVGLTAKDVIEKSMVGAQNADPSVSHAILNDSKGQGHLTITIPANATADDIRAAIMSVLNSGLHRQLMSDASLLTRTNKSELHPITSAFDPRNRASVGGGIAQVGSSDFKIRDIATYRPEERTSSKNGGTFHELKFGQHLDSLYPRLRDDIDVFIGMVASKDHGYFVPRLERQLAMNGEKSAVIEALFPNRPELQAFAWDNEKNGDVSIAPRSVRQKGRNVVFGYFVGYNEPSGFDAEGRPVVTRKVISVKTESEAIALAESFRVGASKAELIQIIKESANTGTSIEMAKGTIAPALAEVRKTSSFSPDAGWTDGDGWQVGDYMRTFATKQEAEAFRMTVTAPETFTFRGVNLMAGRQEAIRIRTKDNATLQDLEQLLRRKISFGTGHSGYQFASKLMQAITYGKVKSGKDKFPASMTGIAWYKFLLEQQISKDEMRITGMAKLLHAAGESVLSRVDLAKFVYAVYPRTFTVARKGSMQRHLELTNKVTYSGNSENRPVVLPFSENVSATEKIRTIQHVRNMKKVASVIELARKMERNEVADALEAALNRTFERLASYGIGLPEAMLVGSNERPTTAVEKISMIEEAFTQFFGETVADYERQTAAFNEGSAISSTYNSALKDGAVSPAVSPQQMILISDILSTEMSEDLVANVNSLLGFLETDDSGLKDNLVLETPFSDKPINSGIDVVDITGIREPAMGIETRPNISYFNSKHFGGGPNYVFGNFHVTGGTAHESMATYIGPYRSNTWLTELWTPRMEQEFNNLNAVLTARIEDPNEPNKEGLIAMMGAMDRVRKVRQYWHSRGLNLGANGHYDSGVLPNHGTFQLGHIRTTQAITYASNMLSVSEGGFLVPSGEIPSEGAVQSAVGGVVRAVEPVLAIEEIQSDNFQYRVSGKGPSQGVLPDSPEQVPILEDVQYEKNLDVEGTEIQKELESLKNVKDRTRKAVTRPVSISGRNNTSMVLLKRGLLESMSNIHRHLLYTKVFKSEGSESVSIRPDDERRPMGDVVPATKPLFLVATGKTEKTPKSMVELVGSETIPVYEWNFDRMTKQEFDELIGTLAGIERNGDYPLVNFFNLLDTEIFDAISYVLPELVLGFEMRSKAADGSLHDIMPRILNVSAQRKIQRTLTPMHLLLSLMETDLEAVSGGKDFYKAFASGGMKDASKVQINYDAMAVRLVGQLEKMVEQLARSPQHSMTPSAHSRNVFVLRHVIKTFKRMLSESRNSNLDPTVNVNEGVNTSHVFGNGDQITGQSEYSDDKNFSGAGYRLVKSVDLDRNFGTQRDVRRSVLGFMAEGIHETNYKYIQFQTPNARTSLGQAIFNMMPVLSETVSSEEVASTSMKRLAAYDKKVRSAPFTAPSDKAREVVMSSSIPYGFEDSYKPVSVRGTVIRAMNSGFKAIGLTDARHHIGVRGHSSSKQIGFLVGKSGYFVLQHDGRFSLPEHVMEFLAKLPIEFSKKIHGGFIERLMQLSDGEVETYIFQNGDMVHNGVSMKWDRHLLEAMRGLASGTEPLLQTLGNKARWVVDFAKKLADAHNNYSNTTLSGPLRVLNGSNFIAPDGTPVKYRNPNFQSEFFRQYYGKMTSGEKNSTQRLIDAAAANVGHFPFFQAETSNAGGYINNYGLPLWFQRQVYWGNNPDSFLRVAPDAFQRPLTESKDGKTYILDPKTGRPLAEIDNSHPKAMEMVREAFLQNSRYLGGLPVISGFLAEFGSTGAYVQESFALGRHALSDSILGNDSFQSGPREFDPFAQGLTREEGLAAGVMNTSQRAFTPRGEFMPFGQDKSWWSTEGITALDERGTVSFGEAEAFSLAFDYGVEPTLENYQDAIRAVAANRMTVMKFAPKFQTEQQREAMRKKIAMGIPLMMAGRHADGPYRSEEAVSMAVDMAKKFEQGSVGIVNQMAGQIDWMGRTAELYRHPRFKRRSEGGKTTLVDFLSATSDSWKLASPLHKALYYIHGRDLPEDEVLKNLKVTHDELVRMERYLHREFGIDFPPRENPAITRSRGEITRASRQSGNQKLTAGYRRRIKQMFEAGYSYRAIAKSLQVGDITVRKWIRKMYPEGVPKRVQNDQGDWVFEQPLNDEGQGPITDYDI